MKKVSIFQRRGFEFSDLEQNKLGILMIESSITQVSPTVTNLLNGTLKTNVLKQVDESDHSCIPPGLAIFQYQQHNWTIIIPFDICASETVSQISKLLQTRCIYLQHENTSSCSSYILYEKGICIEEFCWGASYTEEIWEVLPEEFFQFAQKREAQGNPLPTRWNPKEWSIYCFEGYRSYQFRSNIRTVTQAEVIKVDKFLDFLLSGLEAWLPDWEYLPFMGQPIDRIKATAEDFVSVDIISNYRCVNEVVINLVK